MSIAKRPCTTAGDAMVFRRLLCFNILIAANNHALAEMSRPYGTEIINEEEFGLVQLT